MWLQLYLQETHFAVNLLAALGLFCAAWLYFDAWSQKRQLKEGLKTVGFLLLSLSFIAHAATIETGVLQTEFTASNLAGVLSNFLKVAGFALVITGLKIDPFQSRPGQEASAAFFPYITSGSMSLIFPLLAGAAGFLYLYRATVGLERHLKPIGVSMFALAIYEILHSGELLRESSNINLYNFAAPFGPLWTASHLLLGIFVIILGRWVIWYLLKRLQSQLMIVLVTSELLIFLLTTTAFTTLFVKSLQQQVFNRLETDVKVLNLALESKKNENLSDAQVLAENRSLKQALSGAGELALNEAATAAMLAKKKNSLVIVSLSGEVKFRGEDQERVGDSLSDDPLVKTALKGEPVSSVASAEGVVAPKVSIKSAVPIKEGEETIGAVVLSVDIDDIFVAGIKEASGLDASVYSGDTISATTLFLEDGRQRASGLKEAKGQITKTVLEKGQSFTGATTIANVSYLASYSPVVDSEGVPLGMLFVGKPQSEVLQSLGRSVELTFVTSIILLLVSILPAYLISRFITYQLH